MSKRDSQSKTPKRQLINQQKDFKGLIAHVPSQVLSKEIKTLGINTIYLYHPHFNPYALDRIPNHKTITTTFKEIFFSA